MHNLSYNQMIHIESSGEVSIEDIINGICLGVVTADIVLPIGAKFGLWAASPTLGAILSLGTLACTAYYVFG